MSLRRPAPADPDSLLLIVVGAHLEAELHERGCAHALAAEIDAALARHAPRARLRTAVVTDLWYLNDHRLRHRPVISVGGPQTNAFTAQIADRVPQVHVNDGILCVQADPDMRDLVAACWGVSPGATATACSIFAERWLDAFVHAAVEETEVRSTQRAREGR